jgi:peptidoglycan hydrolase CwlO-like protein
MKGILVNQKMNRQFVVGLCIACLGLAVGVVPVAAENGESKKGSASTSQKNNGLSTDNLQKQISDLDVQIQKLREQSIELQEKTRAKLQAQLDGLRQQRDTLLPRIEKLRDNSETAWQDIKENIQKAIEDLKASVDTMEK